MQTPDSLPPNEPRPSPRNSPSSDDACRGSNGHASTPSPSLNLTQLIDRHSPGVWRYLRMLGCDSSTADDLTQETFLRVLRRDSFVQHSDSATAGYLRRTAYNLLVSNHRKHRRTQTIAEASVIDQIWDRWAGKDVTGNQAIEALQLCFDQLTERAQLALQMRFKQESSRVEIAEALSISDHGARNLMQRAKSTLKKCVESKLRGIENES